MIRLTNCLNKKSIGSNSITDNNLTVRAVGQNPIILLSYQLITGPGRILHSSDLSTAGHLCVSYFIDQNYCSMSYVSYRMILKVNQTESIKQFL